MNVHVSREGKQYGPYTIEDLKSYVAQGSILPTDAAWSEGMSDWTTVANVLAQAGVPLAPAPPTAAPPVYTPAAQAQVPVPAPAGTSGWPDPPDMNWALVLVLSIVTCGIFGLFWMLKQALYAKKLDPASQGVTFYTGWVACAVGAIVVSWLTNGSFVSTLVNLAGLALLILGAFNIRDTLQRHFTTNEPVGLSLHPVMTFFFTGLYFQYHLSRIANWRRTGVLA